MRSRSSKLSGRAWVTRTQAPCRARRAGVCASCVRRAGRSRWRPIYRQVTAQAFVILAVGPEAGIDKAGFDAAVGRAAKRLAEFEVD